MEDYVFLFYLANAYAPGTDCICVISSIGTEPREVSLEFLSSCSKCIISYDLPLLAAILKEHELPLPEKMIDIEAASRQRTGQSHRDFEGSLPWSIWEMLGTKWKNKAELDYVRRWHYQIGSFPERNTIIPILFQLNKSPVSVWGEILLDLERKGEIERFLKVEVPINTILLMRQYKGIGIDEEKFNKRLDLLDDIIAYCGEMLRSKWGIIDSTNVRALSESLKYSGYPHLAEIIEETEHYLTVEVSPDWVEIIKVYENLKKARRDKNILLRFGAFGENRVYPIFEGLGTVTGRILVKNPAIQQLKRSSRDIFAPDRGYSLLYPDFKQFEPGILADDSGDRNLRDIYNSGDVYNALSIALFGSDEHRKSAKGLFLSYSYGMRKENLTELISVLTKKEYGEADKIVRDFFGQFSQVEKWKEHLYEEVLGTGRIGTRLANFRYRQTPHRKGLTDLEKRWVASQRIQGTASLIVKRCILRIAQEVPEAQFLIPMHDAVLYQVPTREIESVRKGIESIFVDEYKQECQSIIARVTFESFWEEDDWVSKKSAPFDYAAL